MALRRSGQSPFSFTPFLRASFASYGACAPAGPSFRRLPPAFPTRPMGALRKPVVAAMALRRPGRPPFSFAISLRTSFASYGVCAPA
eukprot:241555-Heterocapsa_arctica.AAC.1